MTASSQTFFIGINHIWKPVVRAETIDVKKKLCNKFEWNGPKCARRKTEELIYVESQENSKSTIQTNSCPWNLPVLRAVSIQNYLGQYPKAMKIFILECTQKGDWQNWILDLWFTSFRKRSSGLILNGLTQWRTVNNSTNFPSVRSVNIDNFSINCR